MSVTKEIDYFRHWVELASVNTSFENDVVLQNYLADLFHQHMQAVDLHMRFNLGVLLATRCGMRQVSVPDALYAGENGLVYCLIFGLKVDPVITASTHDAFQIISQASCPHLSHVGRAISIDFRQTIDLFMKMRSCSGTGLNELFVL